MKRIIAIVLTLIMLCGTIAMAETETTQEVSWGMTKNEVLQIKGQGIKEAAFNDHLTAVLYTDTTIIGFTAEEADAFVDDFLRMKIFGNIETDDGLTLETEQLINALTALYGEPSEVADEDMMKLLSSICEEETGSIDTEINAWKADDSNVIWVVDMND